MTMQALGQTNQTAYSAISCESRNDFNCRCLSSRSSKWLGRVKWQQARREKLECQQARQGNVVALTFLSFRTYSSPGRSHLRVSPLHLLLPTSTIFIFSPKLSEQLCLLHVTSSIKHLLKDRLQEHTVVGLTQISSVVQASSS